MEDEGRRMNDMVYILRRRPMAYGMACSYVYTNIIN